MTPEARKFVAERNRFARDSAAQAVLKSEPVQAAIAAAVAEEREALLEVLDTLLAVKPREDVWQQGFLAAIESMRKGIRARQEGGGDG